MVNLARSWWQQPDHHEWITSYLESRGIQGIARVSIAWVVAWQGVIALLMAWGASTPQASGSRITSTVVSACCLAMASFWLVRWPTTQQSVIFAVVMTLCTSAVCLTTASPQLALVWCTAFVLVTGYVAFYHSARLMAFTMAVAMATSLACAISLAFWGGDLLMAACQFFLVTNVLLAIPLAVQGIVQYLRFDVGRSDVDPLTNLLNRRAFYHSVSDLLDCPSTGDVHLAAIMIDLDDFKRLNDTFGHAAGDLALVAVADVLRQHTRSSAVCARVGGEEFLVADVCSEFQAESLADRLRDAIAATAYEITASVGLASIHLDAVVVASRRAGLKQLSEAADAAMYTAKRAGGNTTYRHPAAR